MAVCCIYNYFELTQLEVKNNDLSIYHLSLIFYFAFFV
ncbi:MAG: hypothetical protein ACI9OH_002671 [Oleispira sp.]|jgi:hypothetical protein